MKMFRYGTLNLGLAACYADDFTASVTNTCWWRVDHKAIYDTQWRLIAPKTNDRANSDFEIILRENMCEREENDLNDEQYTNDFISSL